MNGKVFLVLALEIDTSNVFMSTIFIFILLISFVSSDN